MRLAVGNVLRRRSRAAHLLRPLPAHVRRHSLMVAAMRLALPMIAAILLAALALWSKLVSIPSTSCWRWPRSARRRSNP